MRREADCGSGVGLSLPGSSLLSWGKLVGWGIQDPQRRCLGDGL
jgi:hypothetical protein